MIMCCSVVAVTHAWEPRLAQRAATCLVSISCTEATTCASCSLAVHVTVYLEACTRNRQTSVM